MENNKNNKPSNSEVIIGKHYCPHCGSFIDKYFWYSVQRLEAFGKVELSARGLQINIMERIASLLKMLGCSEVERKMIIENIEDKEYHTLKIVIKLKD